MATGDVRTDTILQSLGDELGAVAQRYANRVTEITGSHQPAQRLIEIALGMVARPKASPDGTLSLTARRIALGRAALAAPTRKVIIDQITMTSDVNEVIVTLAQRLYGDASQPNVQRLLQAAVDRGVAAISAELDAGREG